jgi:hypothetical protein
VGSSRPKPRTFKQPPIVVVGLYDQDQRPPNPIREANVQKKTFSQDQRLQHHSGERERPRSSASRSTPHSRNEFQEGRSSPSKAFTQHSRNPPPERPKSATERSTNTTERSKGAAHPRSSSKHSKTPASATKTSVNNPSRTPPRVKKVQARRNLYIPSVISVANFSRLLGIRQGTECDSKAYRTELSLPQRFFRRQWCGPA